MIQLFSFFHRPKSTSFLPSASVLPYFYMMYVDRREVLEYILPVVTSIELRFKANCKPLQFSHTTCQISLLTLSAIPYIKLI